MECFVSCSAMWFPILSFRFSSPSFWLCSSVTRLGDYHQPHSRCFQTQLPYTRNQKEKTNFCLSLFSLSLSLYIPCSWYHCAPDSALSPNCALKMLLYYFSPKHIFDWICVQDMIEIKLSALLLLHLHYEHRTMSQVGCSMYTHTNKLK